jgi:hypothetical protein
MRTTGSRYRTQADAILLTGIEKSKVPCGRKWADFGQSRQADEPIDTIGRVGPSERSHRPGVSRNGIRWTNNLFSSSTSVPIQLSTSVMPPNLWPIVSSVFGVILVMVIGGVCRRVGWLTREADRSLASLLTSILIPCLFLSRILNGDSTDDLSVAWIPPVLNDRDRISVLAAFRPHDRPSHWTRFGCQATIVCNLCWDLQLRLYPFTTG